MANQLKEELILEHGQFDSSINKVIQKVEELKKKGNGAGQGFTSSMGNMISSCKNFNGSLGSLLGIVGKFGGALGVAAVGLQGFNKLIDSSQALSDEFGAIQESVTTIVDDFFQSLASGDFSPFLNGIGNLIDKAKEAYDAMDDLQNMAMSFGTKNARLNNTFQKNLLEIRKLKGSKDPNDKARMDALVKENQNIIKQQSNDALKMRNQTIKGLQAQIQKGTGMRNKVSGDLIASVLESDINDLKGGRKRYKAEYEKYLQEKSQLDRKYKKVGGGLIDRVAEAINPDDNYGGNYRKESIELEKKYGKAIVANYLLEKLKDEELEEKNKLMQESYSYENEAISNQSKLLRYTKENATETKKSTTGAKKHEAVYRKEAKTIEELEENVKALEKAKKKTTDVTEIKRINDEIEITKRKIKSLETGSVNKMAKSTSEIQKNIQILTDKLQDLDPNSEEFAKVTRELNEWKDKADDVDTAIKKIGVDLSSNDPKQIKRNIEYFQKFVDDPDESTREYARRVIQQQQNLLKGVKEGSVTWLQQEISKLDEKLANEDLSFGARVEIRTKKEELQRQLLSLTEDAYITFNPNLGEHGRLQRSHNNAQQGIENAIDLRNKGIITAENAQQLADEINAHLKLLNLEPIKVHIETDIEKSLASIQEDASVIYGAFEGMDSLVNSFDRLTTSIGEGANAWTIFMNILQTGMETLQAISSVISMITFLQDLMNTSNTVAAMATQEAAVAESEKMGTDVAAAATAEATALSFKMQEKALLNLASSSIFAAHANIPFAGVPIAQGYVNEMMAQMTVIHALTTALTAYANGGIIGGNSYAGDSVLVRANSGEMLLNGSQQKHLFDLLDRGAVGNSYGGAVEFKLRGSDLYGAMKNYSSIKSKTSDITRFK